MSFFAELKRRNVFKVGIAYAIVAWLLIQIVSIVVPAYKAPAWVMPIFITLISIGFPIALILAWAFELTPDGIKVTATEGPAQFHTRTTGQRLNYFIIGVLVLTVAFLVVDNYVLKEPPAAGSKTPGTSVVTGTVSPAKNVQDKAKPVAPANSIAVLPFINMSEDKANEYFADGLAEELLNKLARVKGLQVTGRTSSFYFKGKNEDLRIIGETLGVANLLEGSVRKSGDQIRITAQLINASDGYHLWSESYDRNLKDIFEVQDEIAMAVTTALSITLGAGEFSLPGSTRNVEAYDEGLKAAALWKFFTQDTVKDAIAHMEQAVVCLPCLTNSLWE